MAKKATKDILKQKVLSEGDILLLCRRANAGEEVYIDEEYDITEEQTKKGLDWLKNQWKTPRGVERKNNPFRYREQDAIDTFVKFTFDGLYNAGNQYHDFYLPIYTVEGKDTSFQYVVQMGKIMIIG